MTDECSRSRLRSERLLDASVRVARQENSFHMEAIAYHCMLSHIPTRETLLCADRHVQNSAVCGEREGQRAPLGCSFTAKATHLQGAVTRNINTYHKACNGGDDVNGVTYIRNYASYPKRQRNTSCQLRNVTMFRGYARSAAGPTARLIVKSISAHGPGRSTAQWGATWLTCEASERL